jgi:hypothetical protein
VYDNGARWTTRRRRLVQRRRSSASFTWPTTSKVGSGVQWRRQWARSLAHRSPRTSSPATGRVPNDPMPAGFLPLWLSFLDTRLSRHSWGIWSWTPICQLPSKMSCRNRKRIVVEGRRLICQQDLRFRRQPLAGGQENQISERVNVPLSFRATGGAVWEADPLPGRKGEGEPSRPRTTARRGAFGATGFGGSSLERGLERPDKADGPAPGVDRELPRGAPLRLVRPRRPDALAQPVQQLREVDGLTHNRAVPGSSPGTATTHHSEYSGTVGVSVGMVPLHAESYCLRD